MRTRTPTFRDLAEEGWSRPGVSLGHAYSKACVRTQRDAVLALLEDPALTRRQLRAKLIAVADLIETWGPDAPYPAVPFYDVEIDHSRGYVAPKHWEFLHVKRLSGETDDEYQQRLADAAPKVEAYWAGAIRPV